MRQPKTLLLWPALVLTLVMALTGVGSGVLVGELGGSGPVWGGVAVGTGALLLFPVVLLALRPRRPALVGSLIFLWVTVPVAAALVLSAALG